MTDEHQEKKPKIGSIADYKTLGSKRSDVQTSRLPDTETFSGSNLRKSKHPEWKQHTVYLPPALSKWLKLFAVQAEMEISEVVAQSLREFQEKHK